MDVDWSALRTQAAALLSQAYAPYSEFPVGAAGLVEGGRVVVGCNVENASYGLALCAECGLVSALHATGGGRLLAVSIVDKAGRTLMPCGRCRQLLYEHGGPDCLVDAAPGPIPLAELLPYPFETADLDRVKRNDSVAEVPGRLLEFVGRGTVFVHRDVLGGRTVWTGYWERASHADEGAGILEEAPTWPQAAAAVAWGRARTPRVVVVEGDGTMSWAGTGDPPVEVGTQWRDA
jgi:cytidine deaminase